MIFFSFIVFSLHLKDKKGKFKLSIEEKEYNVISRWILKTFYTVKKSSKKYIYCNVMPACYCVFTIILLNSQIISIFWHQLMFIETFFFDKIRSIDYNIFDRASDFVYINVRITIMFRRSCKQNIHRNI